jgi:predicted transcriptional regulator
MLPNIDSTFFHVLCGNLIVSKGSLYVYLFELNLRNLLYVIMEMKQVYEALEKVENGADLIAAIKGEINTLNNEAKKHRTAGEQSATKLKSILEAVGLEVL